jgi:pyruvate/2-oxoglutarate dehydrogenase complex dihydrolipoamide dehydrogenase (E3) component
VSLKIDRKERQEAPQCDSHLGHDEEGPNTDGLGLAAAGVETNAEGYISVNEPLQTTSPDVWAMGNVAGSPKFTHAAFHDFQIFTDNVTGGHNSTKGRLIPFCLFS